MSVQDPTYKDIPPGHPIRKFCDDWLVTEYGMREALVELIVGCVITATAALVEGDEAIEDEIDAMDETPEAC